MTLFMFVFGIIGLALVLPEEICNLVDMLKGEDLVDSEA